MVLTLLGEPVAYAIIKELAGRNPNQELKQVSWSPSDRLPSLNTHPRFIFSFRASWAEKDDTYLLLRCQAILWLPMLGRDMNPILSAALVIRTGSQRGSSSYPCE